MPHSGWGEERAEASKQGYEDHASVILHVPSDSVIYLETVSTVKESGPWLESLQSALGSTMHTRPDSELKEHTRTEGLTDHDWSL